MFNLFKKGESQREKIRNKKKAFRLKNIKHEINQLEYRKSILIAELERVDQSIKDKMQEFTNLRDNNEYTSS